MPPKKFQDADTDKPKETSYGIFFLYFDDQKLQQIAEKFIEDLQKYSRIAIFGFTRESIVNEFLKPKSPTPSGKAEGKDKVRKFSKTSEVLTKIPEQLPIEPQTFILDEKNFSQFVSKIKEKIDELVQISKTLNFIVKTRKEFNLLQHWMKNENTKKGKANKKQDEKSIQSKKSARSKGGADKKVKNDIPKHTDGHECTIKSVTYAKLDKKVFSRFQPRIHNMPVKIRYTEDHPLDAIDTYIVLIGKFEKEIIYEFAKRGLPIRAITYFLPEQIKPKCETEHKSIEILNEIEELSCANELRNVATTVFYIDPISECRATVLRNAIFDQLSYHFYDKETERRQYENYLTHLLVSDVSEKAPCPTKPLKILEETDLPMNALDDITVPIYLDALLDLIHENLLESSTKMEKESTTSSSTEQDVDPFIMTPCRTVVFEYSNKLLNNTLASELHVSYYQRALGMYKIAANLKKLYNTHSFVKKDIRPSLEPENIYFLGNKEVNVFCMPLTESSFMQKLKSYCDYADETEIFYNVLERSISISFHQRPFSFMENHKVRILRTKVCFRDYLKYVAPFIGKFIEDQENRYDSQKSLEKIEKQFEEPTTIVTKRDFYRKSSIKERLALEKTLPTKLKDKNSKPDMVSPKYVKDINNDRAIAPEFLEDNVVFPGYKMGEDILRLRVLQASYKSANTQLNLERNIVDFGSKFFSLNLTHKGNTILFNKVNPTNHNIARLRIETYNFINITFDHMPMPFPEDKNENEVQETENEIDYNISYPYVTVTWPSLLRVQNIYDPQTQKLSEVRQYSWRKSIPEKQRFMYPDGSVLIFYLTESVHLLTANGTIYQSGPLLNDFLDTSQEIPEMEEELSKMAHKFQYELEYIMQYYKHLDTENYLITTSEGYNFTVRNGHIVQENHKFLTLEWFDYELGERCSSREDGVKTLTSEDKFICYYPDGTFITSNIKDDMLYISRKDDGAESFIVLPEEIEGHTASAVAVTESIVKELVNIASEELFVFTTSSHLIQHECYATVHFIKDEKVDIRSPGDVNLSFTEKEVNFDLGGELSLRCSEDECIICSHEKLRKNYVGKDSEHECLLNASINFKQDKHCLLNFVEQYIKINVSNDFILDTCSTKTQKYFHQKPPPDLIFEPSHEGFELYSEEDVKNIFDTAEKQNNSIFYLESDLKVLVEPFTTFNKIYRLPIGLKGFLKKFKAQDFICEKKDKQKTFYICEKLKRIMMVRSFYKIDKMHRTMYQSNVNLLFRTSVGRTYGNKNVINKMALITKAVQTAISQRRSDAEGVQTGREASFTAQKTQNVKDIIERTSKRKKVYQRMLQKKLLPNFWDFMEFDADIKNMCVCKYARQLGIVCDTTANKLLYQPLSILKHKERTRKSEDIDYYIGSGDMESTCECEKKSKFFMKEKESKEINFEMLLEHSEDRETILVPPCFCKNYEKGTCACPIDLNVPFECKKGQEPTPESNNN